MKRKACAALALLLLLLTGCGAVNSADTESVDAATEEAASAVAQEEAEALASAAVTAGQAESIALEAAGLAEGDTKYLHSYVEWRHDAPYAWCVEFGVRDTEYVYLIDLEDGSILERYVESH